MRLYHHQRKEDRRLRFLYQRENNNQIASPVRADSHIWMEISFEFLLDCLNIEYFPSQAWRKYRKENSNEFTGKNGYDSDALAKRFLTNYGVAQHPIRDFH